MLGLLFSDGVEGEHNVLNWFLKVVAQSSSGMHACGRFLFRRGACEDSSEASSFDGSHVPGDASCLVDCRKDSLALVVFVVTATGFHDATVSKHCKGSKEVSSSGPALFFQAKSLFA